MAECPGYDGRPNWRCPDGRLLLRYDAPHEEWLAVRRTGIGSSDASAVLGVNRWTSPYEVWASKRGLLRPTEQNDAMELGHLLEPIIVDRWSRNSGIPIRKAGVMQHRTREWQLASVDRLAACGGLVEAKSLSHRVASEWEDGQTPDHAEAQSQHQLAVTGRSHVHVVGLQDGRTWLERLVWRDDALIEDMTKIEAELWQMVLDGVEPPVDASPATTDVLNERWPTTQDDPPAELGAEAAALRDRIQTWQRVAAEAEEQVDLAKNQLKQLVADHTRFVLPDGSVGSWVRNGTFSTKRFAQDFPELVDQFTRPRPAIDVDAIKTERPDVYAALRARVLRVPAPPTTTTNRREATDHG